MRNAWLAPALIDLLVTARRDLLAQESSDAWVVPIPLHWRRAWTRGYNQADDLAASLASQIGFPRRRVLRRVVPTRPLASLGRTERAEIMRRAFQVRMRSGLEGRTVLLVDDIMTSGATCGAAARALKQAGAARVVAVVIGRAEGKV
jgi:ComF family protein